ncbi:MAG: phage major capsid protein [Rhizobiaceae bacterium]
MGEQFTELPGFKSMQDSREGTVRLNVEPTPSHRPPLTRLVPLALASSADRRPGVIEQPQQELTIRQLLLPRHHVQQFYRIRSRRDSATTPHPLPNPGGGKAQSNIQFELLTTPVRTIAHWFAASKQVLSDIPMLQSYINGKALIGLKIEEEDQILSGDGIGQNLHGLIPQASAFMESLYSAGMDTMIDTIRRAALQVRVAQYRPTFVVLNPVDWAAIELTKDGDGSYIEVSIRQGGEMRLWRLNVIETTAIAQGEFLVGAQLGAQVFDREEAAVQISTSHSDFFTKNLIAILAEERLALAVTRPESFVHGYFELFDSPPLNG